MFFKAPLACEQAVYSHLILASANHRDFLMELAFHVIYISLAPTPSLAPALYLAPTIDILYTLDGASLSKIEAENIPAISPFE